MTIYQNIFKKVIFPTSELVTGTTVLKNLRFLEKSQWWTKKDMEKYQNDKLKMLIQHAYNNVPYYHRVFKKLNLRPENIKNKADLSKLPILTKQIIRDNFEDMKPKNFKEFKPLTNRTGGSTGEPLKYHVTNDSVSIGWAANFRGWKWAGWNLGDKRATLGGYSLIPGKNITIKKKIRYVLERNLPLSATSLNPESMLSYSKKINNFKPEFFRGYPSAWALFATFIEENNISLHKPTGVFTTAELLLPHYRKKIEDVFKCEVFDGYGLRDGNGNAMECSEHHGLHISPELSIFEFLKKEENASANEMANIILTDLHNFAFPFIRYDSSDLGSYSDDRCECKRNLPLIEKIIGRTSDIITFQNGKTLSGPAMTLLFNKFPIKQYQIIQRSQNYLKILIIKDQSFSANDEKLLMKSIQHHIGPENKLTAHFVSKISPSSSGKHVFTISKVGK